MSEDTDPDGELSLLEGLCSTRAIRRYTTDPIPAEDLSRILFAATRAPSASNRQPFRFLVLRDGPAAEQARAALGESFRSQWTAMRSGDGYDAGSGSDPSSPKARMAATMQHFVDHIEQVPVVILACLDPWRRDTIDEGASIYPACQNLLLAARALGYGGVLTGWHRSVEPRLRELLEIPDTAFVASTITLGRPAGSHGPVRRRPVDELVFDDRWGASASWATEPDGTRHTSAGPRRGR